VSVKGWLGIQGGIGANGSYQFRSVTSDSCPELNRTQPVCFNISGKAFVHGGGELSVRFSDFFSFDTGAVIGGQGEVTGQVCFKIKSSNFADDGDLAYDRSRICLSGGFYLRLRFYGELNFDLYSGTKCW